MTEDLEIDDFDTNSDAAGLEEQGTDDLFEHHRIVVDRGQAQLRIDKFLTDKLAKASRNKIQNAIASGAVLVDGAAVKSNFKIKPGHTITVVLPDPPRVDEGVLPENIPLDIIYEDEDIMIVNKAAGMVVHPGVSNWTGTLVNALAYHLGNVSAPVLPGNAPNRPGLVHRIDKDTSGLLVIAKNDYAMSFMAKQFYDHTIDREYVALIWGEPEPREGTIAVHIGRSPRHWQRMEAFIEGDDGKHAITHYEMLEAFYYVSLVKCKLETGRTHQIRIHMKHIGHSLFNDALYGGDRILKGTIYPKYKHFVDSVFSTLPRQALHARTLGFTHPTSKERMHFEAPLPEDFSNALQMWRDFIAEKNK